MPRHEASRRIAPAGVLRRPAAQPQDQDLWAPAAHTPAPLTCSPAHLPAPPRCSLPPRLLPDFVQNKRGCRPIRSAQSHPPQARGCREWRRDPCVAASPSGWRSQSYIPPEPPSLFPFARWGLQNKPPNLRSRGVREGGEWDEKGLYRCLTSDQNGDRKLYIIIIDDKQSGVME